MASTSDSHLEAMFGATNDGSLDVSDMCGCDNEGWFLCRRRVESEISNGGLQDGGKIWGVWEECSGSYGGVRMVNETLKNRLVGGMITRCH